MLATGREGDGYLAALRQQIAYAQAIVSALGYDGEHLGLIEQVKSLQWRPRSGDWEGASSDPVRHFQFVDREADHARFCIRHLATDRAAPDGQIALAAARRLARFSSTRTLARCARPASGPAPKPRCSIRGSAAVALHRAQLRAMRTVLEHVSRGCNPARPTTAALAAGEGPVVLNEAEPFHCVRCGKPFGTRRMVESMTGKLGTHSMFAAGGAIRPPANVRRMSRRRYGERKGRAFGLRIHETEMTEPRRVRRSIRN